MYLQNDLAIAILLNIATNATTRIPVYNCRTCSPTSASLKGGANCGRPSGTVFVSVKTSLCRKYAHTDVVITISALRPTEMNQMAILFLLALGTDGARPQRRTSRKPMRSTQHTRLRAVSPSFALVIFAKTW